jgi:hypothetical protein
MMQKCDWSRAVQFFLSQSSFCDAEFFGGVDLGEELFGCDGFA